MAKNLKYNQTTTKKFTIQGMLSADGTTIIYEDADKNEVEVTVEKCLFPFAGGPISLAVSLKTDEDLSDEFENNE